SRHCRFVFPTRSAIFLRRANTSSPKRMASQSRFPTSPSFSWNRRGMIGWISDWKAGLQQTPTESLLRIRRKWEQQNPLARAEWIFLAKYIRVACEEISENPRMPVTEHLLWCWRRFWQCGHSARIEESV